MGIDKRYIGAAITLLVLGLIGYYFMDVISWVILAWIVSLLGSPFMNLLGKLKVGRLQMSSSIRATLVLAGFYAVFGGFMYLLVPVVIQQGRNLAGVNYADIMQGLEQPFSEASDYLIERGLMEGELSKYATKADSNRVAALKKNTHKHPQDTLTHSDSTNTHLLDSNNLVINPLDTLRDTANITNILPKTDSSNRIFADTIRLVINPKDSTAFAQTNPIRLDSLIAKNSTEKPIELHVKVSFGENPVADKTDYAHDTTALVKPSDSAFEKVKKKVFAVLNPANLVAQTASGVLNFFGNFLLLISSVSFIAFFFLKDEELFARGLKAAIPDQHVDKVDAALGQIKNLLTRYFGGILLQITVLTIYLAVGLSFLGTENGLLIGFFAALINVVPYVGFLIGTVFGLLVTISSHLDMPFYTEMLPLLMKVGLLFLTMHLLDGFLLQPIIFSNSVMAHPLEIFIMIVVGAKLGGIVGMITALPIYTIFRVIAASFLSEFKLIRNLTEHLDESDNPGSGHR